MRKLLAVIALALAATVAVPVVSAEPAGAEQVSCFVQARNRDPNRLGPLSPATVTGVKGVSNYWRITSSRIGPSMPHVNFPTYTAPGPTWVLRLIVNGNLIDESAPFPHQFGHQLEPEINLLWDHRDLDITAGTTVILQLWRLYNGAFHLATQETCGTAAFIHGGV